MRLRAAAVLVAGLAASVAILAQGPRMDGKWEVTTEMEMPGMPMKMPPTVSTRCITKADAKDPQKAIAAARDRAAARGRSMEGEDCKMADYKVDGNKVTYTMKCEGRQAMTITGETIYGENTYTSTQTMEMGGRGTMTMKSTAKRLGDCEE
jgi:Protein of unknown function (DUF3617)